MLLQSRGPGQELRTVGALDLLIGANHSSRTSDNHTPTFIDAVIVSFKENAIVDRRTHQLGTFCRPEKHRPILDDKVDGEYLGLAIDSRDEPA